MKNFVKHILAIAICAAALLSSCIKEQEYIRSTTELSVSLTGIEDTRSETQGNLIQDAWIWAYQCTVNETRNTIVIDDDAVPVGSRYVYGLNSYDNISVHLPLPACSEQDGTPVPQSYLLVAVINTEAFSGLNLSANSTWGTVKNATFAQTGTFWNGYPKDNAPEVMPISNWTTLKIQADNTHSDNCYNLNLPVYRAVAKTQLYMSKAGDFDLQVLDAKVVANTEYSQGMLLTGNKNSSVLDANGNPTSEDLKGDNGEKVYQGLPSEEANPWWWSATPAVKTADKGYQLKNGDSGFTAAEITTLGSATNPESGKFTWVASTFLLENDNEAAYGVGAYDAPQGDGYNLYVKYQVGEGGEPVEVYTPLGKVARNHDYKVYATVNAGGEMIFNIVVNEWLVEEEIIDYTNIVTVTEAGRMKWTQLPDERQVPSGYTHDKDGYILNSTEQNVGVVPVTTDNNGVINMTEYGDAYATCTFALSTPVGGTWYAVLETVSGAVDAFEIVEANSGAADNVVADGLKTTFSGTSASGPISPVNVTTGETVTGLVTLKFKTKADNETLTPNQAVLKITAKGFWGGEERIYEVVNLTGLKDANNNDINYSLRQPVKAL